MARTRRELLFKKYDPVRRVNELLAGYKTRASGGLPLGNVYGHVQDRLIIAYRILKALEVGIKLERVNDPGKLAAVGASVQDKSGTRLYPAAHLAPCGLAIGRKPAGAPRELYDVFKNPISSSFVKNIFAKTNLVHVFVNWFDTQLDRTKEGDGFSQILLTSCQEMVRDYKAAPKDLFYDKLFPEFRSLAAKTVLEWRTGAAFDTEPLFTETGTKLYDSNGQLVSTASDVARSAGLYDHTGRLYGMVEEVPSRLVNQFGGPLVERPSDISVNTESREAAIYNDQAIEMVGSAYASAKPPQMSAIRAHDAPFAAIESNELKDSK
jgi:hypothetical protein